MGHIWALTEPFYNIPLLSSEHLPFTFTMSQVCYQEASPQHDSPTTVRHSGDCVFVVISD